MVNHVFTSARAGWSTRQRPVSPEEGSDLFIIITCEHGGNRIPLEYRPLFAGAGPVLRSHRGYDPGALSMARALAHALSAPLVTSITSRLLIDLNRSIGHPRLYSEFTRPLPAIRRQRILQQHYLPYRADVEATIAAAIEQGRRVLHISSHSFTPTLNEEERNTDIGLLYDPARTEESAFCRRWQAALRTTCSSVRTRLNYPYTGKADGFTTYFRRQFTADRYLGIELEINQKHVRAGNVHWQSLRSGIVTALKSIVLSGRPTMVS